MQQYIETKDENIDDQIQIMLEKVLKDDNEDDFNLFTMGSTCEEDAYSFFGERKDKKAMTMVLKPEDMQRILNKKQEMLKNEIEKTESAQRQTRKHHTVQYNNGETNFLRPMEMYQNFKMDDCFNFDPFYTSNISVNSSTLNTAG